MPYVVTENCVDCRFTDCVEVCPVDCFYQAEESLYINPDECIDCGQCLPLCPVEAIFVDDDGPPNPEAFTCLFSPSHAADDLPRVVLRLSPRITLKTTTARQTHRPR